MKKQLFALALFCSMSFLQGSDGKPENRSWLGSFYYITQEQIVALASNFHATVNSLRQDMSIDQARQVATTCSSDNAHDSHKEWPGYNKARLSSSSASGVSSSAIDQFVATSPKLVELTADDEKGIEQIISNNNSGVQSLASSFATKAIDSASKKCKLIGLRKNIKSSENKPDLIITETKNPDGVETYMKIKEDIAYFDKNIASLDKEIEDLNRLSSRATWALNNQATLFGLGSIASGTGAVVAARSENTSAAVGLGLLSALSAYGSYATNQFKKQWYHINTDKSIVARIYKKEVPANNEITVREIKRQFYTQDLYEANMAVPEKAYDRTVSVGQWILGIKTK